MRRDALGKPHGSAKRYGGDALLAGFGVLPDRRGDVEQGVRDGRQALPECLGRLVFPPWGIAEISPEAANS